MYKLVIAEDEERLRRGLCNFIDWAELGFEVVSAFGDGKEVIDYLSRHNVDAVFTDIQMAEVSGLEIAKFVYERQQSCKVIVISGFKEFGYARQAIEYKVEHYLIKPIDIDEIARVFTELKRKLDRQQQLASTTQKDRELTEEIFPFLQEQLFVDLAIGAIFSDQELERRLRLAGLSISPAASSALVSIRVSGYGTESSGPDTDQLQVALAKLLREQTGPILHHIIFTQRHLFKVLSLELEMQDITEFERQLNRQMELIRDTLRDFFGLSVSVHYEGVCQHLFDISALFQKSISNDNRQQPFGHAFLIEKFKLVLSKLNDGSDETAPSIWASYMREISQLPMDKQQELFIGLLPALSEYAGLNSVAAGGGSPVLSDLSGHDGQLLLGKIFDGVAADPDRSSNIMIDKAKQYIELNYAQDLSLDDVAAQVFLHPIYFSRFFKRQTGEKFIDYITRLRMNKAIELLIENKYKVYEISSMVGYRSDKYFAKLFKQHTGYSPRDYLKYIMKVSDDHD